MKACLKRAFDWYLLTKHYPPYFPWDMQSWKYAYACFAVHCITYRCVDRQGMYCFVHRHLGNVCCLNILTILPRRVALGYRPVPSLMKSSCAVVHKFNSWLFFTSGRGFRGVIFINRKISIPTSREIGRSMHSGSQESAAVVTILRK